MNLTKSKKYFLLALPLLLLPSTMLVFIFTSYWFGKESGYLIGFLFYWLVWCFIVPFLYLDWRGLLALFTDQTPLFTKGNWLTAVLFVVISIVAVMMYWREFVEAPVTLILFAIPVATINGIFEEILWRGLYIKAFPNNLLLGFIYPALGFAIWHISPQVIFPSEIGLFVFAFSTLPLGLAYGWIARKTGSVKWTALSHSINGIIALGGSIAPIILALLF